jgi:hypothetical protein
MKFIFTAWGASTLCVSDSSFESPNTILVIENLNLLTMKILCYVDIHLTLKLSV